MLENIENMEEKITMIEKIIVDTSEEERIFKEKEEKRQKEETDKWRKKVLEKDRKERTKKEREEKVRLLSQRWALNRWVTSFINEHQAQWDKERNEKEKEAREELET